MREANKLSSIERDLLSDSEFAIPEERKFPIQDEKQAKTALAMAHWPNNLKYRARVEGAITARYPYIFSAPRSRNVSDADGDGSVNSVGLKQFGLRPDALRSVVLAALKRAGWILVNDAQVVCAYRSTASDLQRYVIQAQVVLGQSRVGDVWHTDNRISLVNAATLLGGP